MNTEKIKSNYLLITLGHNSSALFVDSDDKVVGYEQERLSGIKSDSQFPMDAINEIRKHISPSAFNDCKIRISHWFDSNSVDSTGMLIPNKYITKHDIDVLKSLSSDIKCVDEFFTHHDAHAYSVLGFHNYHSSTRDKYILVADGFGTDGEVLSLYKPNSEGINLIHRKKGYQNSLGLMYQYATSYCGMKENQDEYKFLGYEAHIDEILDEISIDIIDNQIELTVNNLYNCYAIGSGLDTTKLMWYDIFENLVNEIFKYNNYNKVEKTEFNIRVVVAYFIQQTLEIYMSRLIEEYKIENLLVAGGLFYNVKLNNHLLNSITGKFCVIPLAGDQGAAIGMYVHETNRSFPFGDLCFGKRSFYSAEKIKNINYICPSDAGELQTAAKLIAREIADGKIVNLIYDSMEFGPRALGHTSSLFLPTAENVANNNFMNNRNEVMPCAPICTFANSRNLFDMHELKRVVGSDEYMICTHDYLKKYSKHYGGVMHKKTLYENTYTGRPQIVKYDLLLFTLLNEVENLTDYLCLVNTSFNVHGRPIAFSLTDIIQNHNYQVEHSRKGKEPVLYIVNTSNMKSNE